MRPAWILLQDQPTDRDHLARNSLVETIYDALTSPNTKPRSWSACPRHGGKGKSSLLRQLRSRVDPWTERYDSADAVDSVSRLKEDEEPTHGLVAVSPPGERRRSRGKVRARLTRAWAWGQIHRSGDRNAPLAYEMRPRESGSYDAITVWFNPWMYERTDHIWAGLTREILIAVTERLSKPERERLWFDLNLRRTDPTAMRRRILASYIPRTLGGLIIIAPLLLFVVAVAAISME